MALFAGPSPSSGYHFVNSYGDPTGSSDGTHNLIKQLNGLTNFSYQIQANRQEISELGRRELVSRPHIVPPYVLINFDYMGADLRNEMRMGFNPNFPTGENYLEPYYDNNVDVFCFQGFTSRETTKAYPEGGNWPLENRDRRNLFFVIGQQGTDLRGLTEDNFNEINTLAFGDCHILSYSTQFNMGDVIRNSVSYSSQNVNFYSSGSGIIPSVDSTGFDRVNDNIFKIPVLEKEISGAHFTGADNRSLLLTSDLGVVIKATGYGQSQDDIEDVGFDFGEINLQNAGFDITFERRDYIGIGHKIPVDKPIKYPIRVESSLNAFISQSKTGQLRNIFFNDYKYDLYFTAKNAAVVCDQIIDPEVIIQYDLYQCDLMSIDFGLAVNEKAEITMKFNTDVADTVTGKGFFISGRVISSGVSFSGHNF